MVYSVWCMVLEVRDEGTGKRIDDRGDLAANGSADGGFLEGAVGIGGERAVFQNEVLSIAERLGSGYAATDETKVFGVPTGVGARDLGVVDSTTLAIPESVFGIEDSIVDLEVTGVLESVLT